MESSNIAVENCRTWFQRLELDIRSLAYIDAASVKLEKEKDNEYDNDFSKAIKHSLSLLWSRYYGAQSTWNGTVFTTSVPQKML